MARTEQGESGARRILIIVTLMLAGEVVFLLPFVFPRIFRPTVLDVFQITNLELGTAFSVYGIVAVFSYFVGGPLADRYPARNLMTLALLMTSAAGAVLSTIPSFGTLVILYGFWGMTTIMLFWAALIRSARVWGGEHRQGRAYGLLDGGRGLAAALLASASVWAFALILPADIPGASLEIRAAALSQVILGFSGITALVAGLIWYAIPSRSVKSQRMSSRQWSGIRSALFNPAVWLQAIIVLCAYVGYKGTDDFSLYARDAFGYDEVAAARLGTVTFWTRPFAAVAAGLLADRIRASAVVAIGFVLMAFGCSAIALGLLRAGIGWLLIFTIITTSVGIYALRGVYFALLAESHIPISITGASVGIVSVVGFLPDVFMGPWMGYLIDRSPGATGHEHVFLVVGLFAMAGLLATLWFTNMVKSRRVLTTGEGMRPKG